MCVVGALSTYTAALSSVNVSVIDTGRPQSEVQRALEMGFRSSTRSTTFLFHSQDYNYIWITGGKSSPLANLQYSRKWALKLMNSGNKWTFCSFDHSLSHHISRTKCTPMIFGRSIKNTNVYRYLNFHLCSLSG